LPRCLSQLSIDTGHVGASRSTQGTIMKRQMINIATNDGGEEIEAYVSPEFPGLAVHRNARFSDTWTATHIASGLVISCGFRLRRIASEFAAQAGRLLDFTKPGEEVEQHIADRPKLRAKFRELVQRFR